MAASSRHRITAMLAVFAASIAGLVTAASAAVGDTSSGAAAAASSCPKAFPVSELKAGQLATGYTTSKGSTPQPFSAKVLGVQSNGIAPGIDMIFVSTSSPAIKTAGGVWEGMSGSPVYARDGRLIGAVSWRITWGGTPVAALTPAAAMYQLLSVGSTSPTKAPAKVALPERIQNAIVAQGAATRAQAASGMTQMTNPFFVSGVPSRRLPAVQKHLAAEGASSFSVQSGSSAPTSVGDKALMRPGAPISAALTYGDYTEAAVGTVTAVCGNRILAFGHPMMGNGTTTMTAHATQILYVQPDPLDVPKIVPQMLGRVGTIQQDRYTGIVGRLGVFPRIANVVANASASTGITKTLTTKVAVASEVPWAAGVTAANGALTTLLAYPGRAVTSFTATGQRADGSTWSFTDTDRSADPYDVTWTVLDLVYSPLTSITNFPLERVSIDNVKMSVHSYDVYNQYTLNRMFVKQGGKYVEVTPNTTVNVRRGGTVAVRAELLSYRNTTPMRTVDFTFTVPATAVEGPGLVHVFGGGDYNKEEPPTVTSFGALLAALRAEPRNDQLVGELHTTNSAGDMPVVQQFRSNLTDVVRGAVDLQLQVTP